MAAVLALLSSLFVGCSDFLAGRLGRSVSAWTIAGVASGVAGIVFLVLGLATQSFFFDRIDVRAGVATGALLVAGNGLYYGALSRGTMGVVGGIAGTLVLIPVIASLVRGVSLSTVTLIGIAITVGSAVLLGAPEMRGGAKATAVIMAAFAALFYGLDELTVDVGSAQNVYGTLMIMEFTAAGLVAVLALVTRSLGGLTKEAMPTLTAVGLLNAGCWATFATATTIGTLATVSALASLGPAVLALLAFVFLKQTLRPVQIAALGGVLVGSVLVTIG